MAPKAFIYAGILERLLLSSIILSLSDFDAFWFSLDDDVPRVKRGEHFVSKTAPAAT